MLKLGRGALAVKSILLLLTKTVDMFAVVGVEGVANAVIVPLGVKIAHGIVAVVLGGKNYSALALEDKLTAPVVGCGNIHADVAVFKGCMALVP